MDSQPENEKLRSFDWDGADLRLVFCYEGQIPVVGHGQTTARFNSAWWVRTGWAEVTCGELPPVRGHPGEWVFLPSGIRRQSFSEDARIVSIAFVARHLLNHEIFREGLPMVLKAGAAPSLDRRAARLIRLATGGKKDCRYDSWEARLDLGDYLKLKVRFLQWLEAVTEALQEHKAGPAQFSADPLVAEVLRIIRSLAPRQEMKIAELAAETGISASQLQRRFTRSTGVSLHRHYTQFRLEAARERLRRSKVSLKEIAYDMGFQHPANFSNWFKARAGKTPSAYRRQRE